MDYQPKPQFVESVWRERCAADCSRCPTFPAPFRRLGESSYCHFSQVTFQSGEGVTFQADDKSYLLFVLAGSLVLEHAEEPSRLIPSKQCVCLGRNSGCTITACDDETRIVVLALMHHMELCEQDVFLDPALQGETVPQEQLPALTLHPLLEQLLASVFQLPELADCEQFHRMKTVELFMLIKVLYTPTEHLHFFQSMIDARDNFRIFVCNNYEKARSASELAAMAGMSLSAFKRRFTAQFHDSVYHWMMERKAHRILADIHDGEDRTKTLMQKYGFRYYTQFSRFCKNYLQATPAQLIARTRSEGGLPDSLTGRLFRGSDPCARCPQPQPRAAAEGASGSAEKMRQTER